MTLDALLARLDRPRKTAKGWSARCPSHQDCSPSLSVHEGERGLLVHCFSGCTLDEICGALGLNVRDLFYAESAGRRPHAPRRPTKREVTEHLEYVFWASAIGWELYGLRVMDHAKGLDTATWSDTDFALALALAAISKGYDALRVAQRLHGFAFRLRIQLSGEVQHGCSTGAA